MTTKTKWIVGGVLAVVAIFLIIFYANEIYLWLMRQLTSLFVYLIVFVAGWLIGFFSRGKKNIQKNSRGAAEALHLALPERHLHVRCAPQRPDRSRRAPAFGLVPRHRRVESCRSGRRTRHLEDQLCRLAADPQPLRTARKRLRPGARKRPAAGAAARRHHTPSPRCRSGSAHDRLRPHAEALPPDRGAATASSPK